ncbi:phage antirepressor KilAC domain-containing protein [Pseudothauera rhizosphaerae]|uniref:Antirepressor protein C-terminal domain-containing protein n=1 Tax=Pseudothauera rhizosphaerae TaxID=2565932 RepID=A0A4S4ACK2_9RHOO|nr:phage antirepressor KilAC domain-containing protein [Pseudothauera rhizosphaerae]THF55900.1 hypothetical protein E6O51_20150 [Pseudothauera rhizosphaerae]
MNALIPTAGDGLTMSSIDLLEMVNAARKQFGETEVRRNDFVARCKDELDGEYYETFVVKNPNGTESEAIKMTRDQCMYVLMRESKAVRRSVTNRLKALEAPAIPQTLPEALRLAAEAIERNERLALENKAQAEALAEAAPKVQALELISAGKDSLTLTQAAKVLGVKISELTTRMHAEGWIYRQNGTWVGYDYRIKSGALSYKEANYTDEKTGLACIKPYCHVTPKGLVKLAVMFGVDLPSGEFVPPSPSPSGPRPHA